VPTYFDAAIPVDPSGGSFTTSLVNCNVCGVFIKNTDAARSGHANWHDSVPKGASSGMVSNQAVVNAAATADIIVPLSRTMANTTYSASPILLSASGTLLGTVSVVGIQVQTTTSVTVRIKNTGLSSLAVGSVAIGVIAVG
jgi:hypothetical protein